MELLMEHYVTLNKGCEEIDDAVIFNEKFGQLLERKRELENQVQI